MGRRREECAESATWIVIGINCVFVILGIIIIASASSTLSQAETLSSMALINELDVSTIAQVITFSGIGTLIAFFKWRKVLLIYLILLFILCITQLSMSSILENKDAQDLYVSWSQPTKRRVIDREAVMTYFECCGFERVTDSYQLNPCHIDLEKYPKTQSCRDKINEYIQEDLKPLSTASTGVGIVEILAIIATLAIIFTSKEYKPDWFQEHEFH